MTVTTTYAAAQFDQAIALLPYDLRRALERLPPEVRGKGEEIRLRAGRPVSVTYPTGEVVLRGSPTVDPEQLRSVLEIASQASAHTVLDQVKNGFLTVRGGHRLGLCGSGVMKDGTLHNLRCISSIAIRVARAVDGVAGSLVPQLLEDGRLGGTLLLSPPGCGKTTLLRDIIRCVSVGEGVPALRVGVADERGELAALWGGVPQMDLGPRTDVMDGCPKAAGMMMLLRGMNPQVLAVDEITASEDIDALEQAAGCGVILLATAHGGSGADLSSRPLYRRLMALGVFRRLLTITLEGGQRSYRVSALGGDLCCT